MMGTGMSGFTSSGRKTARMVSILAGRLGVQDYAAQQKHKDANTIVYAARRRAPFAGVKDGKL